MCGIVGEVSSNGRPVNERVIERMCAAITHRGPDDEGYYFNPAPRNRLREPFSGHSVGGPGYAATRDH